MSSIDKVELYPFSPLKLLHETRKMTAAQAKFFVALMCLFFEKFGFIEYLHTYELEKDDEAKEKNAALHAPYCGVTKKTFMKMIDALHAAEVIRYTEDGCIEPKIAEEIRDAFLIKQTHMIMTYDDLAAREEAVAKAAVAKVGAKAATVPSS